MWSTHRLHWLCRGLARRKPWRSPVYPPDCWHQWQTLGCGSLNCEKSTPGKTSAPSQHPSGLSHGPAKTKPKISRYRSLWFCCYPFLSMQLVSFKQLITTSYHFFIFWWSITKKITSKSLISFCCHWLRQKISFCNKLIKLFPFLSISGCSWLVPWVPGWGGRPHPWPLSCRTLTRGDWSRTHWPPPLSPHLASSLRSDLHLQHTRSVDKIYQ